MKVATNVDILLSTTDDVLAASLTSCLTDAGYAVRPWHPGEAVPREVRLLLIDGLDGVVAAHDVACDVLALVEEDELVLFAECPREIDDFAVKPASVAEVLARVRAIAARPAWRERIKQRLLAVAVESAEDVIEITSPNVEIEYVNPAHEKVLGYSADEVTGQRPTYTSSAGEQPHELVEEIESALARGERWTGVIVSRAKDGRLVHLESVISTVTSSKGEITHRVAVKRDISERLARQEALLQANRAIEAARDAAVKASRAKSEFLANMSHELRTPLNAIIGYSELLLEQFSEGEVAEDLSRIRGAGTHLLSLINDVLDISKIEAQKIDLVPEWIEPAELVDQVIDTTQPLAQKNANRVRVELPPDLGRVRTDRTRLRQVLLNLLSNACKFTKGGEIVVHGARMERQGAAWIEIRVSDTGVGISAEHQQKLFQPFVQADSSTTREFGGTGLGLAISKRLVEMMGGDIALESALGVGTTIRVRLPVDHVAIEPPALRAASLEASPAGSPTVLLIDDDEAVRDLFTRLLSKRGFRPLVAATGHEGLDAAAQLEPDAIVLDVKMPGLDGWEVLSALKLSEKTARIPVIMLTVMQQREVGQALGAADYLLKPIDPVALTETLRRHVVVASARVLIVEDDEATRSLVRRTLAGAGHVVFEAENGQLALEALSEAQPDLIVLDLMMPVMDGFTFLERIRKDARWSKVPVVIATARALDETERLQLERSVLRIIEKNACSRSELLDAIAVEIGRLVAARKGWSA